MIYVFICIIYLHVIEASLKTMIVMFYFCHSKRPYPFQKTLEPNVM